MAEQGPVEEEQCDPVLRKKVHSQVFEILRTIFAWFDLPWRDLTIENMFEQAHLLKKVDKDAIRFSKFIPLGYYADAQEASKDGPAYNSKL